MSSADDMIILSNHSFHQLVDEVVSRLNQRQPHSPFSAQDFDYAMKLAHANSPYHILITKVVNFLVIVFTIIAMIYGIGCLNKKIDELTTEDAQTGGGGPGDEGRLGNNVQRRGQGATGSNSSVAHPTIEMRPTRVVRRAQNQGRDNASRDGSQFGVFFDPHNGQWLPCEVVQTEDDRGLRPQEENDLENPDPRQTASDAPQNATPSTSPLASTSTSSTTTTSNVDTPVHAPVHSGLTTPASAPPESPAPSETPTVIEFPSDGSLTPRADSVDMSLLATATSSTISIPSSVSSSPSSDSDSTVYPQSTPSSGRLSTPSTLSSPSTLPSPSTLSSPSTPRFAPISLPASESSSPQLSVSSASTFSFSCGCGRTCPCRGASAGSPSSTESDTVVDTDEVDDNATLTMTGRTDDTLLPVSPTSTLVSPIPGLDNLGSAIIC
ncbi:hypothetical protein AX16_007297 [Volvariella volvacea WC 439]|nr:hypothetical protein AX16_007297 [Volvariella volvacea WC 439]